MTNNEKCKKLEARLDALEEKLSCAVQSGDVRAGRISCEAYAVQCELDEAERIAPEVEAAPFHWALKYGTAPPTVIEL